MSLPILTNEKKSELPIDFLEEQRNVLKFVKVLILQVHSFYLFEAVSVWNFMSSYLLICPY